MTYPIEEKASLDKKGYASFGFLTSDITNQLDCLGLSVLEIVFLDTTLPP
jgi:Zn-dependent M16 (insulinase) family peptidase